MFWLVWFGLGIIYVLVNGFIRKLYTDGDWLVPLIHLTIAPFFFLIIGLSLFKTKKKSE